ncbi:MAG: NAD+ synthase [Wenzhouxiangellaceae bacterium]
MSKAQNLRVALAQINVTVGDINGNRHRILDAVASARDDHHADLVVFPELALTGYPADDLLLRPGFLLRAQEVLDELAAEVQGIDVVIGHPAEVDGQRYNSASWIRDGHILGRYDKHCLPNYAVFDERRYFSAGEQSLVIEVKGVKVGVIICEDGWFSEPIAAAKAQGAQLVVAPNASPYRRGKQADRQQTMGLRARENDLPLVYANLVGGQDELLFDGRSMFLNADGGIAFTAAHCQEQLAVADLPPAAEGHWSVATEALPPLAEIAEIYQVLVLGLRDYLEKNDFPRALLGLSGGIDSALSLALAVDALGAEQVTAVYMPSAHSSELSDRLAQEQAEMLGVRLLTMPIDSIVGGFEQTLTPELGELGHDITAQNLQARARGMLLMALSNARGAMLLATGNKSEMATGYSTLYGDMCGGYAPIKDVSKTLVYALSEYRNRLSPAVPRGVIDRPPSAELAPGQMDSDSLPPYDVLDPILERYVERDASIAEIVEAGFAESIVRKVAGMVLRNEYKRRQAAPGTRITRRAFGRDRRYPITSGWRESGEKPS